MSTIGELTSGIRGGGLKASEVLEGYLEAADRRNPSVNAFVTRTVEEARMAAHEIDRSGTRDGALLGVPFTVKDNIQTEGVRTTAGSLLLAENIPTSDAPAVARLKAAGAVMVGKTSCPEFAMDIHTSNRLIGATRNPLDTTRTSGGSSGGDSAAVAAGFAAFGLGTDYGGSVRWPAHCCGMVAIRPTMGRVPSSGVLPNNSPHSSKPFNSLSVRGLVHTVGPIAASVADLRAVFDVLDQGGPEVPAQIGGEWSDLRITWFDGDGNVRVRSDLVEHVRVLAGKLEAAGAEVVNERPPGIENAVEILRSMRDADGLGDVAALASGREEDLAETTRAWLEKTTDVSVARLQELAGHRDAIRAKGIDFMGSWPVWLLPVAAVPAFPLNRDDPTVADPHIVVDGRQQSRYDIMSPCWAIAMYGFPSVVVPCGWSTEGLPVGVQIVGPPNSDRLLLDVAASIEEMISLDIPAGPDTLQSALQ